MYSPTPPERPRKRRAINACISCRSAKVRCDGKQPCERCDRNDAACQYYDAAGKDPNTARIEKLEAEVTRLQDQLNDTSQRPRPEPQSEFTQPRTTRDIVHTRSLSNTPSQVGSSAVEKGLITYDEAFAYFTR